MGKFKISIILALASAALSLLLGLVFSVRFFTLIFRAFIIMLLVGGFSVGVQILFEKLLTVDSSSDTAKDDLYGKNVDINIDAEADEDLMKSALSDLNIEELEDKAEADEDLSVLDELPNLDSFVPASTGETEPVMTGGFMGNTIKGSDVNKNTTPVIDGDAASIAKAVQTVLSQDSE